MGREGVSSACIGGNAPDPAAPSYVRSTQTEPRQAGRSLGSPCLHGRCQPLGQASRCLFRRRGVQREGGVQPSSGWRCSQALLIGSVPRRALRARAAPGRRWRLRRSSCPSPELRVGPRLPAPARADAVPGQSAVSAALRPPPVCGCFGLE